MAIYISLRLFRFVNFRPAEGANGGGMVFHFKTIGVKRAAARRAVGGQPGPINHRAERGG
jgi:hypothetical protein